MRMTKDEAVFLLGGSYQRAADAIGVHRQTIKCWERGELSERHEAEAVGAALRIGYWPPGRSYRRGLQIVRDEWEQVRASQAA